MFEDAQTDDCGTGEVHNDYAYYCNSVALADAVRVEDEVDVMLSGRDVERAEHIVHTVMVNR